MSFQRSYRSGAPVDFLVDIFDSTGKEWWIAANIELHWISCHLDRVRIG
jgi:hypothetical protein